MYVVPPPRRHGTHLCCSKMATSTWPVSLGQLSPISPSGPGKQSPVPFWTIRPARPDRQTRQTDQQTERKQCVGREERATAVKLQSRPHGNTKAVGNLFREGALLCVGMVVYVPPPPPPPCSFQKEKRASLFLFFGLAISKQRRGL